MNSLKELTDALDSLIDGWCERRALRPLQLLLRVYPGPLIHTDHLFELLDAVRDVKGLARAELTRDELSLVVSVANALEDVLSKPR